MVTKSPLLKERGGISSCCGHSVCYVNNSHCSRVRMRKAVIATRRLLPQSIFVTYTKSPAPLTLTPDITRTTSVLATEFTSALSVGILRTKCHPPASTFHKR